MDQEYFRTQFGRTITNALDDASIVEIMLNPNGQLWMQRHDGFYIADQSFEKIRAQNMVQAIAQSADLYLNEENPSLICTLPFSNARISICIPPVTSNVAFNIRKPCITRVTLAEYHEQLVISDTQFQFLVNAIKNRKNILVSGSPGSGKTTFSNALLSEIAELMPNGYRVLILEDTGELQSTISNTLFLKTSPSRTMTQLIQYALRAAPKAIVVGEIVDGAALDLLKAWNVGCPGGVATIHANSASMALQRLEDLAMEVSVTPPKNLIGETVNVIVHLDAKANHPAGRLVTEMIEVNGFDSTHKHYRISAIH